MEKKSYVVMLRPAPAYGEEDTEKIVAEHFKYLQDLLEKGILIMAGMRNMAEKGIFLDKKVDYW